MQTLEHPEGEMNKKQTLFYKIASYVCIAFALIHLTGHFQDPSAIFPDEEGMALFHSSKPTI